MQSYNSNNSARISENESNPEVLVGDGVATFNEPTKGFDRGDNSSEPVEMRDLDSQEEPAKQDFILLRAFNYVVPRGGLLSGAFNLASFTLGAGIMSLPSAFKTSGIIMATFYLVIISFLTVFSIKLVGEAAVRANVYTFEGLARLLFGRGGDIFVAIVMWLLCFGGCVGYVIAMGDVVGRLMDHDSVPTFLRGDGGRRVLMVGIWLLFMFPLVLPKSINALRYVSTVGVLFMIFFVFCIVAHAAQNGMKGGIRDDLVLFTSGNIAVSGLSIFIFSFLCQINALVINRENKNQSVNHLVLQATLSCSVCFVIYFITGFFGYADFGPDVEGNILKNYNPYKNPVFFVCFAGIIIKLCAAYALTMLACRRALFQVLHWDVVTMPYWKHTIVSTAFAVAALILGLFVKDISIVFGLCGALCGGFIGFVFPSLFFMYVGGFTLRKVGWVVYFATYFLLLSGVVAIVFGTCAAIYGLATG